MITKAIVEEIIDKYTIRVRIPSIDRVKESSVHTASNKLKTAIISTLPNCSPNVRPGDIVIVANEDTEEELIILGYLYRSKITDTLADLILSELKIVNNASLPEDTTIGNVTSSNIRCLEGVRTNIQEQLDYVMDELNSINSKL